jgi:hypothetical protein
LGLSDQVERREDEAPWVVPTDPMDEDDTDWNTDLGGPDPTPTP